MFPVMSCNGSVGSFRFYCLAIRTHKNTRHQAERAVSCNSDKWRGYKRVAAPSLFLFYSANYDRLKSVAKKRLSRAAILLNAPNFYQSYSVRRSRAPSNFSRTSFATWRADSSLFTSLRHCIHFALSSAETRNTWFHLWKFCQKPSQEITCSHEDGIFSSFNDWIWISKRAATDKPVIESMQRSFSSIK